MNLKRKYHNIEVIIKKKNTKETIVRNFSIHIR